MARSATRVEHPRPPARDDAASASSSALPSSRDIEAEFGLYAGDECDVEIDDEGDVRCACEGCARWKAYVSGTLGPPHPTWPQYEVFTREHMRALAEYLSKRARAYADEDEDEDRPRRRALEVLEVGAGDGRLSRALNDECAAIARASPSRGVSVTVRPTDDGSLGLARGDRVVRDGAPEPPERVDAAAALERYRPTIVLACWQPMGVDWTAAMRACDAVREYVLVGETDDGVCGRPWETWGYRGGGGGGGGGGGDGDDSDDDDDARRVSYEIEAAFSGDFETDVAAFRLAMRRDPHVAAVVNGSRTEKEDSDDADSDDEPPPHEKDGFARVDLKDVSARQICRTDERWRARRQSRTVSFRRVGKEDGRNDE